MAQDKICKQFVGMIAPEDRFTSDTIEDLIARKYLIVGDIVQVNAEVRGDGKYHKRIIEDTNVDGVQLANGLWANIYYNKFSDSRLSTTDKTVVGAINENRLSIIDVASTAQTKEDASLNTTSKNVVGAINEIQGVISNIPTEYQTKEDNTLTTEAKTIVAAINELKTRIDELVNPPTP